MNLEKAIWTNYGNMLQPIHSHRLSIITLSYTHLKTGEVYTDVMEIPVLELGKLPPEDQNEEAIIRWMRFLNAKSRKELKEMAKQDEYFGEAYELSLIHIYM